MWMSNLGSNGPLRPVLRTWAAARPQPGAIQSGHVEAVLEPGAGRPSTIIRAGQEHACGSLYRNTPQLRRAIDRPPIGGRDAQARRGFDLADAIDDERLPARLSSRINPPAASASRTSARTSSSVRSRLPQCRRYDATMCSLPDSLGVTDADHQKACPSPPPP